MSDQRRNNERGLGKGLHLPADQNRGFQVETNLNGEEFVFKNDAESNSVSHPDGRGALEPATGALVICDGARSVWDGISGVGTIGVRS